MTDKLPRWRTKDGRAVHETTADHRPGFAKRLGVGITDKVGTMGCAGLFCLISLLSLPATLVNTGWISHTAFPGWLVGQGLIGMVSWVAQTFLQLVLLSVIIVGQNAQAEASDARAVKTFEDGEQMKDWLDLRTEGGLAAVLKAIYGVGDMVSGLAKTTGAIVAALPHPEATPAAPAARAREEPNSEGNQP